VHLSLLEECRRRVEAALAALAAVAERMLASSRGFCQARGHFRNAASGVESRRAQGWQRSFILLASIRLGDGCQCSEAPADAAGGILEQR